MTTIPASLNSVEPVEAIELRVPGSAATDQGQRLSCGQAAAVTMLMVLGVVVAGYGLAGSYVSIAALADRHHVPLAELVSVGIDDGLVAVVVLDLVLTWIGSPVGWLRQLVRVPSVGTVAANSVAGWPDPVAVGLHVAAPLMLLAMIPLARRLLAPWRTPLLWLPMALWQITSYRSSIDTELQLRRAITFLRVRYGRRWSRRAPADVVWMLRTGVAVDEACERVRVLLGGDDSGTGGSSPSDRDANTRSDASALLHGCGPASSVSSVVRKESPHPAAQDDFDHLLWRRD